MPAPHLVVQRADLVRELGLLANVVERKTTIPILANVKIEAANQRVTLTGTDLEIGLTCSVPGEIKTPGVATLPAKRLLDYARLLPEGAIEIRFGENHWATITVGRSRTRIAGIGADGFPELPKPATAPMQFNTGYFSRLVEQTAFAISKEESRFTLNGSLLEIGDSLRMVATDGHRLAISGSTGAQTRHKALIPRLAMTEAQRLIVIAGGDAALEFSQDENHYFIVVGGRTLTARKLTGQFPDYERVLPKNFKALVTVNTAELKAAIERASLFADERSRAIALSFVIGEVIVTASTSDSGEGNESVAAEYVGEAIKIGLNAGYLIDFLGTVGTEKVDISLNDSVSAVQLSPAGETSSEYRYVVMPMRL